MEIMFKFLGIGSAFNTKLGNTSAFIRKSESMILIDCGGTVFHSLMELKLLEGLRYLNIVITHTHPDHLGSLGEVIFYSYYILGHRPTVYFPKKELILNVLSNIGVSSEMYIIESNDTVNLYDKQLGEVSLEFLPVLHVDTIPSWSFVIKLDGLVIYYSGDANDISPSILERLRCGEIDRLYQDTCGLDYDGNAHMSLRKLCETITPELRNKVYCMHFDKHITQKEIRDKGFNVVKVYKGCLVEQ